MTMSWDIDPARGILDPSVLASLLRCVFEVSTSGSESVKLERTAPGLGRLARIAPGLICGMFGDASGVSLMSMDPFGSAIRQFFDQSDWPACDSLTGFTPAVAKETLRLLAGSGAVVVCEIGRAHV